VAFANSGIMTVHSVVEEYGLFGFKDKKRVSSELNYLCTTGCLKKLKDAFMPTYELRLAVQSFDKPAMVQPREATPFRELSNKFMLPKVSPRGEPLREISYIGLGASIAEHVYRF
jgi:hypothetical protein